MYPRKVKKGIYKGDDGWGCPLCFILLPEHSAETYGLFNYLKAEFMQGWEEELSKEEDDLFDFWKKPKKKSDNDSDLSE